MKAWKKGAKAGLASGIILSSIYTLSFILSVAVFILGGISGVSEVSIIGPIVWIIGMFLLAIGYLFIGGYYRLFVSSEIYFVILLIGVSSILGGVFQSVFNFLPTKTTLKKGLIYSAGIWLLLGILAYLL